MKNNTDDLNTKVEEACKKLDAAGGIHECSDTDWQAFGNTMDKELARSQAYADEMNDIIKMISPNNKEGRQDA